MGILSSKTLAGFSRGLSANVKRFSPGLHSRIKDWSAVRAAYVHVLSPISGPDMSVTLHALRSAHLRSMPKVKGALLSAGCAGTWYFDWIKDRTGHSGRHIGIEYYTPKPHDLPAGVEWIANTVGNMSAVGDGTCQLVFSGQNLEHLWPEDVAGFFSESNRVLEDGGWLVVDSPNRLVTAPLTWSHPEHTVEFTPDEVVNVATLAGFDVTSMVGLWTCRDAQTGRVLPFSPDPNDDKWTFAERIAAAHDDPNNAFIWWMTARKSRPPRVSELKAKVDAIFAAAWPERKTRFVCGAGTKSVVDGRSIVVSDVHETGPIVYGPYMPLKAGKHFVEFTLHARGAANPEAIVANCDVVGSQGRQIAIKAVSSADLWKTDGKVRLDFKLDDLEFGIQARCISFGVARLECELPVVIDD